METRANYIIIGVFTLAGFLGLLAFFMWFARFELDRQFAYYEINFSSVSGLSRASDVRFSGLPVGQVVHVGLSPTGDGTVRVLVEIEAATPVRADSIATIEAQGVTGVSYVAISAGTPDAPLLATVSDRRLPEITSGRSVLQSLTEDAPEILGGVLNVLEQISGLLGAENQARIDAILANLEAASGNFSSALDDFASVSGSLALAGTGIAGFAERLDEITAVGTETMQAATTTLSNLSDLAVRAQVTLDQGDAALTSVTATFESTRRFMDADLPSLVSQLTEGTTELRADLSRLSTDARGLISEYTATGAAATARLNEAEATLVAADTMIAQLNETLAAFTSAAGRFDTLLETDGAPLAAEARAAIAGANDAIAAISTFAEVDLPATMTGIRSAIDTVNQVIAQVGGDVSGAAGRFEGLADGATATMTEARGMIGEFAATGAAATARLNEAEATLAATDAMIARLNQTLGTVDSAAGRIDTLLEEDGAAMVAEARAAIAGANTAITMISAIAETDLPAIVSDIRSATETANRVIAQVGGDLSGATGRFDGLADGAEAALASIGETFGNANVTLAAINEALTSGERTLEAAERAFAGADRVINEDISGITSQLRETMARLDTAIAQVSDDIPAVTADLRAAAATANTTFAELGQMVGTAGGAFTSFATTGLPEYTRLAQETRGLITSLERLTRQIEREPARFFLDRQTPEFRR